MQEKLFYKIGEVSQITGLEAYVLRFWESEFPALHPKKSRGNQRVYTKREIDLVLQIKKLLYEEGMTIAGAKKKLGGSQVRSGQAMQAPRREETLIRVRRELEEVLHILS
ncbi:MAG: MerR family transcriptional regulator [Candidatus Manganitrophaceae bacterium]|nr:MAG: MerR family transcriptional regulator [Candidatus Manganitrophaceae bacterium]